MSNITITKNNEKTRSVRAPPSKTNHLDDSDGYLLIMGRYENLKIHFPLRAYSFSYVPVSILFTSFVISVMMADS